MPLEHFARMLGPQLTLRTVRTRRGGEVQIPVTADPGSPDEVWIKLLQIRHGRERHTPEDWHKLIDKMRDEPAHWADPRYRR